MGREVWLVALVIVGMAGCGPVRKDRAYYDKITVLFLCVDLQEKELFGRLSFQAMSDVGINVGYSRSRSVTRNYTGFPAPSSSSSTFVKPGSERKVIKDFLSYGFFREDEGIVEIYAKYENETEKFVDETRQNLKLQEGNSAVLFVSDGKTKRFVAIFVVVRRGEIVDAGTTIPSPIGGSGDTLLNY